MMQLEALERAMDGVAIRIQENGSLGGHGGEKRVGLVFIERGGEASGESGARGEKGIAQNAEYPSAEVGPRLEARESLERFGVGFLYEVFGVGAIGGEPVGEVVERVEEGQCELRELLLIGARRLVTPAAYFADWDFR